MITKFLGRLCSSMQLEKKADSFYRFLYRREKLTPFFDFTSVQFSRSAMSDSLQPHEPQHTKPPCPSLMPITTQTHVHWVSDAIQPSCPLLSPSSPAFNLSQHQGFFQMSQLFTWGGQSIRISASISVLPMNTQGWYPLGWTGWIFL